MESRTMEECIRAIQDCAQVDKKLQQELSEFQSQEQALQANMEKLRTQMREMEVELSHLHEQMMQRQDHATQNARTLDARKQEFKQQQEEMLRRQTELFEAALAGLPISAAPKHQEMKEAATVSESEETAPHMGVPVTQPEPVQDDMGLPEQLEYSQSEHAESTESDDSSTEPEPAPTKSAHVHKHAGRKVISPSTSSSEEEEEEETDGCGEERQELSDSTDDDKSYQVSSDETDESDEDEEDTEGVVPDDASNSYESDAKQQKDEECTSDSEKSRRRKAKRKAKRSARRAAVREAERETARVAKRQRTEPAPPAPRPKKGARELENLLKLKLKNAKPRAFAATMTDTEQAMRLVEMSEILKKKDKYIKIKTVTKHPELATFLAAARNIFAARNSDRSPRDAMMGGIQKLCETEITAVSPHAFTEQFRQMITKVPFRRAILPWFAANRNTIRTNKEYYASNPRNLVGEGSNNVPWTNGFCQICNNPNHKTHRVFDLACEPRSVHDHPVITITSDTEEEKEMEIDHNTEISPDVVIGAGRHCGARLRIFWMLVHFVFHYKRALTAFESCETFDAYETIAQYFCALFLRLRTCVQMIQHLDLKEERKPGGKIVRAPLFIYTSRHEGEAEVEGDDHAPARYDYTSEIHATLEAFTFYDF